MALRIEELAKTIDCTLLDPRAGAQEIERRRVRQDPWSVYGGRLGGRLGSLVRRWTVANAPGKAQSIVTQAEEQQDWFELTPAYEDGLDFWVEVRG